MVWDTPSVYPSRCPVPSTSGLVVSHGDSHWIRYILCLEGTMPYGMHSGRAFQATARFTGHALCHASSDAAPCTARTMPCSLPAFTIPLAQLALPALATASTANVANTSLPTILHACIQRPLYYATCPLHLNVLSSPAAYQQMIVEMITVALSKFTFLGIFHTPLCLPCTSSALSFLPPPAPSIFPSPPSGSRRTRRFLTAVSTSTPSPAIPLLGVCSTNRVDLNIL